MFKKIILLAFIVSLSGICFGQSKDSTINWEENVKLKWENFQGPPLENSSDMAMTSGSMSFEFKQTSEKDFTVILKVFFVPAKSWVKKGQENDKLLVHEQVHFDIYEIYGRKMIQRIKEIKATSGQDLSDKVGKVFNTTFGELNKFQDQYDLETNHSKIQDKQDIWTQKVKDLLEESKPFAQRDLNLTIKPPH